MHHAMHDVMHYVTHYVIHYVIVGQLNTDDGGRRAVAARDLGDHLHRIWHEITRDQARPGLLSDNIWARPGLDLR